MSLQFTPTLINIMTAFQKQGLATNSYYSRDQLNVALDRMTGREFDRAVSEQLYEQCQVNYKQQILLEDFGQVLMEADKILKRKINQTEEQIHQFSSEKQECQGQLQQAKYNQQVNAQGVEKDSILSIMLHEAKSIRSRDDYSQSFVKITVGRFEHITNGSQGGDKQNPIYSQQFQFNIETGSEDVDFKLYVLNRQNMEVLVGQAQIELGELHDQQVKEMLLQLRDPYGHQINTTLTIEVQWMYNKFKAKYYEDFIKKLNENMESLQADLDDFKRDLETIQAPFYQVRQSNRPYDQLTPDPYTQQLYNSNQTPQQQQYVPPQSIGGKGSNTQSRVLQQPHNQQQIFNQGDAQIPTDELNAGLYLILLFGVFTLFESFARPAYLDILIFLLLLIIIILDHFEPEYIKIVSGLCIVGILYDIIWLSYNKASWLVTNTNDPLWSSSGESVIRLAIILSVLNLVLKAILCYFLYHYYKESQTNLVYKFKIYIFEFDVGRRKNNLFRMDPSRL